MKDVRRILAAAAMATAIGGSAWACEEPVTLEPAQARELLTLIKTPEADALDQIFGFETLMCAKRSSVRDLAVRTALDSPNKTLRSSVMFELLFAKEQLLVEFLPEEGLSKEQYAFIKAQPSLSFIVAKRTREANCFIIKAHNGSKNCADEGAWNLVEVSGTRVNFFLGDAYRGTFALTGGDLIGTMNGKSIAHDRQSLGDMPVRIRLID